MSPPMGVDTTNIVVVGSKRMRGDSDSANCGADCGADVVTNANTNSNNNYNAVDASASDTRVRHTVSRKINECNSRITTVSSELARVSSLGCNKNSTSNSNSNSFQPPLSITHQLLSRSIRRPISSTVPNRISSTTRCTSPPLAITKDLSTHPLLPRLSHSITTNAHLNFPVYCLAFTPCSRYVISGSDDNLCKIWQVLDGSSQICPNSGSPFRNPLLRGLLLIRTLRGHAGVITDVAVNSRNTRVATGSDDGDVRVWELRTGEQVGPVFRGHVGGVNLVRWFDGGVVSTGEDGCVRVWVVEGEEARHERGGEEEEDDAGERGEARLRDSIFVCLFFQTNKRK